MKIFFTLILTSLCLVFVGSTMAQTITSAGSGNWSSGSTWVGGNVPDSTQNVVIAASNIIVINDGTAACNSISFADTSSHLVMGYASSVLSVYGNFTLFSTGHKVFPSSSWYSWPTSAKIKFVGGAATQTLSGWNTAGSSTSFMEMIVNKWSGKVVTAGNNMRFSWGTSLEIISGTFELALTDDIETRNTGGTGTAATMTVDSGAVFNMVGSTSVYRLGTFTGDESAKAGIMTVYGTAYLACGSSSKINLLGISIENGGLVDVPSGRSTTSSTFNIGSITIKNGGTFQSDITTAYWYTNSTTPCLLDIQNGGELNITSTTFPMPQSLNANGNVRYSKTDVQTLPAAITTYNNLYLSGSGIKTLGATITVNGTLSLRGTANLALGGFALNYGPSSILQYGSSGQTSADTTTDVEWPATGGPVNVTIYNTGGVTLHANRTIAGTLTLSSGVFDNNGFADDKTLTLANGAIIRRASGSLAVVPSFAGNINLEYYSSVTSVTTSFEMPSSLSVLNNLTISSTQGVTLGSSATVNGILTLSGSNLKLGPYNLTAGSVSGGNASGYVVTDGSGSLTINNVGASNITFPVGFTDTFTPVVLNNSGTPDNFSVNVNDNFDNPPYNNDVVNKKWNISEGTTGGSSVAITLQWNTADENPLFVRTNPIYIGKYNGSGWDQTSAVFTNLGSGVYLASGSGITSFSSFGIGNNGAFPVELSAFTSTSIGRNVNLNWETKTEVNFNKFEIDRASVSSLNSLVVWTPVGVVTASGNSNSSKKYSYTEKDLQAGKYQYRLKMIDNDGSFKLSNVIETEINLPKSFELNQNYPNPFNPETIIQFNIPKASDVNISIYNSVGQKVATLLNEFMEAGYYQKNFSAHANGQILSSGIYFYVLNSGDVKIVKKMILMK
jgi:hypothetical protein